MTEELQKVQPQSTKKSLVTTMANKFSMEPMEFFETLKKTVFKNPATNEQVAAFLIVANEYKLNPFTREVHAFASKDGGVVPIVGIDGWINLTNSHPQYDGVEFDEIQDEKGLPVSCKTLIYRKDRKHPTVVTEYYDECFRQTDPWKKWGKRMLRHKSFIQCARLAFGFAGIYDPDEAERIEEAEYEIVGSVVKQKTETKTSDLKDKLESAKPKNKPKEAVKKETPTQPTPKAEKPVESGKEVTGSDFEVTTDGVDVENLIKGYWDKVDLETGEIIEPEPLATAKDVINIAVDMWGTDDAKAIKLLNTKFGMNWDDSSPEKLEGYYRKIEGGEPPI